MVPPFDILRVLRDGAPLWMEAVQTLEEAKARVQQLAANRTRALRDFQSKDRQQNLDGSRCCFRKSRFSPA